MTAQQQLDGVLWAGLGGQVVINIIYHSDLGGRTLCLSSWTTVSLSIVQCESEPNPVTPDKNKWYHKQDHALICSLLRFKLNCVTGRSHEGLEKTV